MATPSETDITKIDIESLYSLGASTLEPVHATERGRFKYWRCASLARIMVNFAMNLDYINAGPDPVVHFTDNYEYASRKVGHVVRATQWTTSDAQKLADLTERDPSASLPLIVVALDEQFNDMNLRYRPADGLSSGYVYDSYLPLTMLDPYSRQTISDLLTE